MWLGPERQVLETPNLPSRPDATLSAEDFGQAVADLLSLVPDPAKLADALVVDTPETGFVENGWTGRSLQIGDAVRLTVFLHDPRCVMTTRAQEDLPEDTEVLRTLVQHNRLDVGGGDFCVESTISPGGMVDCNTPLVGEPGFVFYGCTVKCCRYASTTTTSTTTTTTP